jgi:hypothetical protein
MRLLRFVIVIMALVGLCSADTKIKTRKTVMGHTMENTVYVKGARQRTEEAGMMGMPGTTTIVQCDQKRIITINVCTKTYMITPMDEMAGPAMSPSAAMAAGAAAEQADRGAPQKGGVVTIVNSAIDTKEREKMFGLEARHIKSSMSMEPSPDACSKTSMKMERDGWYVSLSPHFTCEAGPHRFAAGMGGGRGPRPACRDAYRMKGGSTYQGFPLKETITYMAEGHPFTMTEEVTELSTANLNPALFDIPAGYRQVNDYMAMMGDPRAMASGGCSQGIAIEVAGAPAEEAPAPAAAPTPAPAAAPAPARVGGTLLVGVVKIADKTNQYLPTDNLRLNLMYELSLKKIDSVPLTTDAPDQIVAEAKQKGCDYILYTNAAGLGDPGQPAPPLPGKGTKATTDPNNYNARLDIQLFKTAKTVPQLNASVPGSAPVRAVDAVMDGFGHEAQAVRDQIDEDLHPKKSAPTAKPAAKRLVPNKK